MPKSPILNREVFYERLRDGSFRMLDWALVNTTLGTMVEPRQPQRMITLKGHTVLTVFENSFTRIVEMQEDKFFRFNQTGGRLMPLDFAN
jgi:hypothetical protein